MNLIKDKNYFFSKINFAILTLWLLILITLSVIIIQSSIRTAEYSFHEKVESLYRQVSDTIKINETLVEGFAASVDAIGPINQSKIRAYAKKMLSRYPHIFMFEIAEKVAEKDKKRFEKNFRKNIYPGFKIRKFGYESDRQWHSTKSKEYYLPITFMEPFPPGSRQVLGLDLTSNQFFTDSLKNSARLQVPVATAPFILVEGNHAYVLHRPIDQKEKNAGLSDRYAMIVVLAESMFDKKLIDALDYDIKLYYRGFRENDSQGYLFNKVATQSSLTTFNVFPKLSITLPIKSKTQPFNLFVSTQLGWDIINWWLVFAFIIFAAVTFIFSLKFARAYYNTELNRLAEADNLFYLANHDTLTGLANRNLMQDRLQHAVGQAERNASKLAVLFMDLDEFKIINDRYGHDAGDNLLRAVSERLRACMRNGDTLARRSGDEFVLVLENIESEEMVLQVVEKIQSAFEESFYIEQGSKKVGISIGYAIFPDEAANPNELLNLADKRMYKSKAK